MLDTPEKRTGRAQLINPHVCERITIHYAGHYTGKIPLTVSSGWFEQTPINTDGCAIGSLINSSQLHNSLAERDKNTNTQR